MNKKGVILKSTWQIGWFPCKTTDGHIEEKNTTVKRHLLTNKFDWNNAMPKTNWFAGATAYCHTTGKGLYWRLECSNLVCRKSYNLYSISSNGVLPSKPPIKTGPTDKQSVREAARKTNETDTLKWTIELALQKVFLAQSLRPPILVGCLPREKPVPTVRATRGRTM